VEIEPESPWKEIEMLTQEKFKDYPKGTDTTILLTDPYIVNPIVRRAQKEEIPATLCKIIDDIDIDQRRGKQLVNKVLGKNNPYIETCPATTCKVTYTPVKGYEESGEETTIIEKRSLTRTELQQYRTEFAQRGEKDVTYLEGIWSNGANTVKLSAAEIIQLAGMTENPHIHEGLLMALEA
jgi:hypothetical protein